MKRSLTHAAAAATGVMEGACLGRRCASGRAGSGIRLSSTAMFRTVAQHLSQRNARPTNSRLKNILADYIRVYV